MTSTSDIADSLTLEEIPIKLRCASCNKLAQEAVRLPCCDQNICADCQANKLETTCPICYHEPINAEDCRPNKALRQTIKIFLKKKAIDRDNAKKQKSIQKAAAAGTPATPQVDKEPSGAPSQLASANAVDQAKFSVKDDHPQPNVVEKPAKQEPFAPPLRKEASQDIPQPSIESPGPQTIPRRESTATLDNEGNREKVDENEASSDRQQQMTAMQQNMEAMMAQGMNGFGFDGSTVANMGLNGMGDMNQMMQMMQNTMTNPMMTGFPNTMGMSGMGMDPMAMQGMFNNFVGPGMMNGMNMGMGFDAGQGAFGGGFSGQPQGAWNSGNQNGFGGAGNFAANSGYGAGYNMPPHQGKFNQMPQPNYPQNDFHQHGYHNQGFHRGRGRGRGAYPYSARGRGNHHQVNQDFNANSAASSQQLPQGPVRRGSPEYTPMNGETAETSPARQKLEEPIKDEFAPGDAEDRAEEEAALKAIEEPKDGSSVSKADGDITQETDSVKKETLQGPTPPSEEQNKSPNEQSSVPDSVSATGSHDVHVPVSTSSSSAMPPPPSPSIPTGPSKPFSTDSSPNVGAQGHGRGRGYVLGGQRGLHGRGFTRIPNGEVAHIAQTAPTEKAFAPPSEPKGLGVAGAPTGPKAMRQGPQTAANKQDTGFSIVGRASAARGVAEMESHSPARSKSRSPSKHRSSRHRDHRDRSASPYDDYDDSKRKDRHPRHSRRYGNEYEDEIDFRKPKSSRTRDPSLESTSKRSSHRSHREPDYEKEREKQSKRSSHRSHRHKDRAAEDSYGKSSRRRSRSPDRASEVNINGASKPPKSSSHHDRSYEKEHDYPNSSSSSKRHRSRDVFEDDLEDTDHERHRHHRSKRSRHCDKDTTDLANGIEPPSRRSSKKASTLDDRIAPSTGPVIPTGPKAQTKPDFHALEREKRDRERQMKELQRRALAGNSNAASSRRPSDAKSSRRPSEGGIEKGGGGDDGGIKINGAAARRSGRKISVRYEDELDDMRR